MKILSKNINKIILFVILILTVAFVSGCFGKIETEKFETSSGYVITLDTSFYTTTNENLYCELSVENINVSIDVYIDEFIYSTYPNPYVISADDYALDYAYDVLSDIYIDISPYFYDDNDQNVEAFDFLYTDGVDSYYCYVIVHKGTDAFWVSEFSCLSDYRNEMFDDLDNWIDSIRIP